MTQTAYSVRIPSFLGLLWLAIAIATLRAEPPTDNSRRNVAKWTGSVAPAAFSYSDTFNYGELERSLDDSSCCQCSRSCCSYPSTWGSVDYLLWWTKGNDLPPLVTTSPAGTARGVAGVLGPATTTVLFGNQQIDDEERSGLRVNFGCWLDECAATGVEFTYFSIFDDESTGDFQAGTAGVLGGGAGLPILARPFFNVTGNREDAQLISFPGVVDGQVAVSSSSELHSLSALVRRHWRSGCKGRIDLVGGYRYLRFREGLLIQNSLISTDPAGLIPIGTTIAVQDQFIAENDFHGGDLGAIAAFWSNDLTLEILTKVSLGNLHHTVRITGTTLTDPPPAGGAVATNGGLLALPTNIGQRTSNSIAAVPELGVNLNYRVSDRTSVRFGYSLVMLTDVVRTGEQIDRSINTSQFGGAPLAGAARPAFTRNEADFWAHGLNCGLQFQW